MYKVNWARELQLGQEHPTYVYRIGALGGMLSFLEEPSGELLSSALIISRNNTMVGKFVIMALTAVSYEGRT